VGTNRWQYYMGWPGRWSERWRLAGRLKKWRKEALDDGEEKHVEPGEVCLVDEMMVLVENGWIHI